MLHGLVSSLITPYLSKYLNNLNAEHLRLGLWRGEVELGPLELRSEALSGSGIGLRASSIGCLRITIPWHNLQAPIKVDLHRVFLLLVPQEGPWRPEEEATRRANEKQRKLNKSFASRYFEIIYSCTQTTQTKKKKNFSCLLLIFSKDCTLTFFFVKL
jgi:hypothetical protein